MQQLQQVHKELKVELQSVNRLLEKKKAMLDKERKLNQGLVEETATLQVSMSIQAEYSSLRVSGHRL